MERIPLVGVAREEDLYDGHDGRLTTYIVCFIHSHPQAFASLREAYGSIDGVKIPSQTHESDDNTFMYLSDHCDRMHIIPTLSRYISDESIRSLQCMSPGNTTS